MLGRYDRAMRARWPVGRLTLLQQAIAAIRRNNGALFYVPGNFAGAWTDSAGTDPVDAVADVLGLMTDRSYGGAVGDELVTNGAWTISGKGVTVSGNTVTFTSSLLPDSCQNTGLVVSGKAYTARLTVSGYSGGGVSFMVAGNSIGSSYSANGTYSQVIVPGASGAIGVMARGLTTNAVVSSISVREIIGNHATQATTANKPTVRRPAANNVIRFDSSNDSLSINLASGGSPFVRSYTRTGTVSGFTSATTSAFVLGQPTVAGRDVCAIVCAPSAITGADLTAIERWAASIGATN